jgi:NAD(P)H-flavin reductase/ferredoxin
MTRHRVTVVPAGTSFEVRDGERVLAAARRHGVWLPFECGWGSCGTCKVALLEGEVTLLFADAPAVGPRDAARRRVLTCQTTPRTDLVIKPAWAQAGPRPELGTEDHLGRLVGVERLGGEIRRFAFDLGRPAVFRPGQHAVLELGPGLRRCYSMSGLPGGSGVEFVAKRYAGGPGSGRLAGLAPGDEVPMELPYGDMWLRAADRPVFLVAGGTGISAVLALLRQLAAAADPRPVRVFYGAGTTEELVCWAEVQSLVAGLPHGRLYGTVLRGDPDWPGGVGLVTAPLAAQGTQLCAAEIYLAGPPPMVDAVLALLRGAGVRLDRLHYDRFG